MKNRLRRLYMGLTILLFIVITPLIILYAQGYRCNTRTWRISKVGMIVVKHTPTNAITYVDDKPIPFMDKTFGLDRIRNLKPDNYNIRVELESYQTWQKTLPAQPDIATWARYVVLFKDTPRKTELFNDQDNFDALEVSPDQEKFIILTTNNNKAVLATTEDAVTQAEFDLSSFNLSTSELSNIAWNQDNERIILVFNSKCVILDTELLAPHSAKRLDNVETVRWDPANRDKIIFLEENTIKIYDLASETVTETDINDVVALSNSNNKIYLIQKPPQETGYNQAEYSLYELAKNKESIQKLAPNITTENALTYEIKVSANGKIAVLSDSGNLSVIRKDELSHRVAQNIDNFDWAVDNDKEDSTDELLLYANSNEIFVYDSVIENSEPITRFAEEITHTTWLPLNYKYILFATNNKIKTIELDEQFGRQTFDLIESTPDKLILDKKGKKIYYLENKKINLVEIR